MASMVIHDLRLAGQTPTYYNFVFQVNEKNHIRYIMHTIARRARQAHKLKRLHFLCHGYESELDLGRRLCMPTMHGGFGLALGMEGFTLHNYGAASVLRGLVDEIVLFACAPAETFGGNRGTYGDGQRFCGYLAQITGARVIAARETQYYANSNGPIDFGAWEGPVYLFSDNSPDGERIMDPSPYRIQNSTASAA